MAAIGVRAALFLAMAASPLFADRASDVLSQLEYASNALTNNNAPDAMTSFDKSCPNYDQIRDDFAGLTDGYIVQNELNVTDEDDSSATETTLTVNWILTLSPKGSGDQRSGSTRAENGSQRRTGDIHVRLILKKRKWKIVEFSPLTIFDPELKQ